jgi:serine/threonine protein kinase
MEKRGKFRMLVRSLCILQALQHRAIIQFVNYILSPDDSIYILFEACKRGSLDDLKQVLPHRPHRLHIIKYILYQLAEALTYLGEKSVVHRDLKPSNITFDGKGQLKLIDFDEAVCFDSSLCSTAQLELLS